MYLKKVITQFTKVTIHLQRLSQLFKTNKKCITAVKHFTRIDGVCYQDYRTV